MFEFLRIMNIWNLKTKYLWGLTGISQTLQLCIKFHYMHIYTANLWTRMVSTPLSETKNPVILSFSSLRPNTLKFTHLSLLLKKWLIHYLLRSSKWKKMLKLWPQLKYKKCTVEFYPRITQYFLNYLMLTRNLAVHNTLSIMYYVTAMYHSNVCTHVRGVWVSVLNHSTTLLKKMQTPTLNIVVYIIHWASFIILSNEYNPYFGC